MKFPYVTIQDIAPEHTGFYRISHEAYHRGIGISSSRVKKALKSYDAYTQAVDEDSQALAFGRAFHMAILEPELYRKRYKLFDGASRNSKAWDIFSADAEKDGREALLASEHIQIGHMIGCIDSHPEYAKLPTFDSEIMAIARCPDTALQLKCKADLFGHAIVDFKTTSSGVTPADFMHDVVKWNYHVSAAFYQDIIERLTGERLPFILVPVTKKAPFECEFYTLSAELLDEGRKLYKAALHRIAKWSVMQPETRTRVEKKMRVLHPNARVLYSTVDTLAFIEGI